VSSIDDLLDNAEPRTETVKVSVRGSAASELETLGKRLTAAVAQGDTDTARGIGDKIETLGKKIEAEAVEFTFAATNRTAWSKLLRQHPPSDADRRSGADYDTLTFPAAAMALTCSVPGLTDDQAKALANKLSAGQFDRIWQACISANVGVEDPATVPLFASSIADLLASPENSTTALPEESPTAD